MFNSSLPKGGMPSGSDMKSSVMPDGSLKTETVDWLPSANKGEKELSMRVTAEMVVFPSGNYQLGNISMDHNREVAYAHPRMYLRDMASSEIPDSWELIPLGTYPNPPMAPDTSG